MTDLTRRAYLVLAAISTASLVVIANSSLKGAAVDKLKATCIASEAAPLLRTPDADIDFAVSVGVRNCGGG